MNFTLLILEMKRGNGQKEGKLVVFTSIKYTRTAETAVAYTSKEIEG